MIGGSLRSSNHNITDAAVVALASGCKKLVWLTLDGCDGITDAARANIENILEKRRPKPL